MGFHLQVGIWREKGCHGGGECSSLYMYICEEVFFIPLRDFIWCQKVPLQRSYFLSLSVQGQDSSVLRTWQSISSKRFLAGLRPDPYKKWLSSVLCYSS